MHANSHTNCLCYKYEFIYIRNMFEYFIRGNQVETTQFFYVYFLIDKRVITRRILS